MRSTEVYYILADDGKTPVAVSDPKVFGNWRRDNPPIQPPCAVGKTEVGDANVSTVFLGHDHNWFDAGPPILWESMVFGGEYDQWQERYRSYDEAAAGHARIVEALKAGESPGGVA